jgi:hypothetical protein
MIATSSLLDRSRKPAAGSLERPPKKVSETLPKKLQNIASGGVVRNGYRLHVWLLPA